MDDDTPVPKLTIADMSLVGYFFRTSLMSSNIGLFATSPPSRNFIPFGNLIGAKKVGAADVALAASQIVQLNGSSVVDG